MLPAALVEDSFAIVKSGILRYMMSVLTKGAAHVAFGLLVGRSTFDQSKKSPPMFQSCYSRVTDVLDEWNTY